MSALHCSTPKFWAQQETDESGYVAVKIQKRSDRTVLLAQVIFSWIWIDSTGFAPAALIYIIPVVLDLLVPIIAFVGTYRRNIGAITFFAFFKILQMLYKLGLGTYFIFLLIDECLDDLCSANWLGISTVAVGIFSAGFDIWLIVLTFTLRSRLLDPIVYSLVSSKPDTPYPSFVNTADSAARMN